MFKKIIYKRFVDKVTGLKSPQTSPLTSKNTNIRPNVIKENYSIVHGNYKHDGYNTIQYNPYERKEIIKRENKIFRKWKDMLQVYYKDWEKQAYSMTTEDADVGEEYGDFVYYNVQAKEGYEILKRRGKGRDEVVLDIKTTPFIKDIRTTNLKNMRLSYEGRFVSFIVDLENNEKYTGGVYDIANKRYYNKAFENVSAIEFMKTGEKILLIENNEVNRPYLIKQHTLNWEDSTNITSDNISNTIFRENNSEVYIETSPSKDNNFLIVNLLTKEDSQVCILDLHKEQTKPELITLFKRKKGVKHFIEHAGNSFYILSNLIVEDKNSPEMSKNEDYKLFTIRDDQLGDVSNNLKLLIFPEKGECFEDMDVFKDYVAVYYKKDLQPYVLVVESERVSRIQIGSSVGEVTPGLNKYYDASKIIVQYSSPVNYKSFYEIDLVSKKSNIIKEAKVMGMNIKDFVVEETSAPAKDGEKIPLTLLHRKDIKLNRKNKTLLIGYGAYGLNQELGFDHVLLTAAMRGWVIAYSHLRGGNEKGRKWHQMGSKLNKPMVIQDYLACAYELIQAGYTHPNYLAGYGSSAGGAVVAQAVNLEPNLFRAAILSHPFLDILTTLFDESLPLTITDYQEYGNPLTDRKTYFTMLSYSPYENISNQEYPAMLINMSLDDPRVPFWGTLKYIEKLRNKAKEPTRLPNFLEKNICVKIDQAGHFGPVNQEDALKDRLWEMMWCDRMLIEKDNLLI